jgi:hypothetical protein
MRLDPLLAQFRMDPLSWPSRAYEYIEGRYGFIGLLFCGIVITMGIVMAMFMFDRRR